MKTIKKISASLCFVGLMTINSYASNFLASFVECSEQMSLEGLIELNYRIYTNTSIHILGLPEIDLPTGWNLLSMDCPQNHNLIPQDTFNIKIKLSYPTPHLRSSSFVDPCREALLPFSSHPNLPLKPITN